MAAVAWGGGVEVAATIVWKFLCLLTASVPVLSPLPGDLAPETLGDECHGVHLAARQQVPQQCYVGDGQPQRVDLAQPLLVGKRGHVEAQLLEGRVDAVIAGGARMSKHGWRRRGWGGLVFGTDWVLGSDNGKKRGRNGGGETKGKKQGIFHELFSSLVTENEDSLHRL